ncbi:MAG: 6-phosphogluconolactonase [archaeon]
MRPTIIHCKNYRELSKRAAELILKDVSSAKKQFSISIPGGNSVKGVLEELAAKKANWNHVNVFMADERVVPLNDNESNYKQANEIFFSKANGIHAHAFIAHEGIDDYNKKFLAITKGKLDLLVLGVGEDGHIASLFPNSMEPGEKGEGYVMVKDAPKPPKERISLSVGAIKNAEKTILLFASESKKPAFENFMNAKVKQNDCPAKIVLNSNARVFVYTAFGEGK